jgi:membrane-associated phospholipid phosphatase
MNANHTEFGDFFFRFWTEFGGGWLPFVFIGLLLLYRYSYALYLLSAQVAGGIVSLIAKRIFDEPRPLLYFQENFSDIALPLVEGVRMYKVHSFPSGHTITGFALFFGLALIVKNKWLKLLFFLMAGLVGYSRVYLSQHFAIDIFVGSAIGILSAWACYPFLVKMEQKWDKKSLSDVILRKKNS